MSKRMRTKNPFCTGTQLVVLQAVKAARSKLGVRAMAREARMPPDTFANALTKLLNLGHVLRDGHGRYAITYTGKCLIDCASRLARGKLPP